MTVSPYKSITLTYRSSEILAATPVSTLTMTGVSISTNDVIVVISALGGLNAATTTVTSVTATGLTFNLIADQSLTGVPNNNGVGTGTTRSEVWWAYASADATVAITVNYSGALNPISDDRGGIYCFTATGCTDPTSPWDTNVSLPAITATTNMADAMVTMSTDSAYDMLLFVSINSDAELVAPQNLQVAMTAWEESAGGFGIYGGTHPNMYAATYGRPTVETQTDRPVTDIIDAGGTGGVIYIALALVGNPPAEPLVSNLSCSDVSYTAIGLSWTASGGTATYTNIRYRVMDTEEWSYSFYTSGFSLAISGLESDTTYEWQLQPGNVEWNDEPWSDSAFCSTLPLPAPDAGGGWFITSSLTTEISSGAGDIWIDNLFVDFSDSVTRDKFINSDGTWISLGYYGQLPTGTSPLNWLTVQDGNPPSDILYGYGQDGGQSSWYLLDGGVDPTTAAPYADMTFDLCALSLVGVFGTAGIGILLISEPEEEQPVLMIN